MIMEAETASETLNINSKLTWLIARKNSLFSIHVTEQVGSNYNAYRRIGFGSWPGH
jgi:hypothetical protein